MNYMRLRFALNVFQALILTYATAGLICLPFVNLCLEYAAVGSFTVMMVVRACFHWALAWYLIGPVRNMIKDGMENLECRQRRMDILSQ